MNQCSMDEICRLCLAVSVEMACKISEGIKVMHSLSLINIQVHLSDSLPSYVCSTCFKILEDIQKFRENVIQNEHKLLQLHNGKNLDAFYQSMNKKHSLKMLKTEIDKNELENDCCGDADYDEYQSINKMSETKDCVKDIFKTKTDNFSGQDSIPNSNTQSNKTSKKIKSLSRVKTKRNRKPPENCLEIQNDMKINADNITGTVQSTLNPMENEINIKMENSLDSNNTLNGIKMNDHKCLTCFEYLNSPAELIRHYKSYHAICSSLETVKESETTRIAPDGVYNKVNFCTDKNNEKMVNATTEMDKGRYNCNICGRTFPSVYALTRHGRAHSSHTLNCSQGCGFSTVYKGALREHERRHQNDFRYKCTTCGAGFLVKTWHDQHQNIHNNVKPYICDVCGMAFHMHRYLTSHQTTIHPEITRGIKRYICPHCDSGAFSNVLSFRSHLEGHKGKRGYLCDLCGKVCRSSEQLKHHNNSHLGLKSFSCSICQKKFAKKFNLTVHEKAHAGEKHLCNTCGKHFAQRSTLRRHHRRAHMEEKHVCNACGKHFALRSLLRSHHKTCHPDITE